VASTPVATNPPNPVTKCNNKYRVLINDYKIWADNSWNSVCGNTNCPFTPATSTTSPNY
jgi:hypothetical protein